MGKGRKLKADKVRVSNVGDKNEIHFLDRKEKEEMGGLKNKVTPILKLLAIKSSKCLGKIIRS